MRGPGQAAHRRTGQALGRPGRSRHAARPHARYRSVRFEFVLVIKLERWILLLFLEKAVTDDEGFDLRSHETTKRVTYATDDWFAADIETGIDQDWAPGKLLKACKQCMIPRVCAAVDGLDPRRIIDVSNSRDGGARHIQFVDPKQRLLVLSHCPTAFFANVGHQEHVRRIAVKIEPIRNVLPQNRWGER